MEFLNPLALFFLLSVYILPLMLPLLIKVFVGTNAPDCREALFTLID
jgi:hypothetical protein